MSRNSSPLSVVLPTVASIAAVVLCLVEWQSSRGQSEQLKAHVLRSVKTCQEKAEGESAKMGGALRSLRKELDKLSRQVSQASLVAQAAAAEEEKQETAKPERDEEAASPDKEKENLPPLPEGVDALAAISNLSGADFFENPEYNPEKKTPSRADVVAAVNEVNTARANMEIANGQVQLAVAKALEDLKTGGHYVDYQQGQAPEAVEGVISAGEVIEGGGLRMYYFYPQDYPEIYQGKEKAKDIAETAFRRLLSMVNA